MGRGRHQHSKTKQGQATPGVLGEGAASLAAAMAVMGGFWGTTSSGTASDGMKGSGAGLAGSPTHGQPGDGVIREAKGSAGVLAGTAAGASQQPRGDAGDVMDMAAFGSQQQQQQQETGWGSSRPVHLNLLCNIKAYLQQVQAQQDHVAEVRQEQYRRGVEGAG